MNRTFTHLSFLVALYASIYPVIGRCEQPFAELRRQVQAAVELDPRLLEARGRVVASAAQIDAASAAYQPSIVLSTRVDHNNRWGSITQISTDEDRAVVGSLKLNWNLFHGGRDDYRVAAFKSAYEAAQHALRQIRLEILAELIKNILDYRKYAALILSATEYGDQTRLFATRLERSNQLGQTSALELERAIARNEEGLQSVQEFVVQRDAADVVLQKKFNIDLNHLLPPLATLAALPATAGNAADLALCSPDLLADTPLIGQRKAELAARQQQISAMHAEYAPTLDLQATRNAGRYFYEDLRGGLSEKRVELTLSIPLFDGGQIKAQVAEATALKTQAQAALDTVLSDSRVNRLKNCAKWNATQRATVNAENTWHRMEKIMAGLEREHHLGFKNSFDLLDASRDNFLVARQFVEHVYDSRLLLIQLRLNEADGGENEQYANFVANLLEIL